MHEVLQGLRTEEDGQDFEQLREVIEDKVRKDFIVKRTGWSRGQAEFFTPICLKRLRPVGKSLLVWQPAMFAFQGYYPKKVMQEEAPKRRSKKGPAKQAEQKFHSCSRSYQQKRTMLAALTQVVAFLWKQHAKAGYVSWLTAAVRGLGFGV